MSAPTTADEVQEVVGHLVDAIHTFVPGSSRAQLAPLGEALAAMFTLFTRISAENVAPYTSQQVINMADIQRMRGQISDLRTVQGDLMSGRAEIEARIAALEAQVKTLMEKGQP